MVTNVSLVMGVGGCWACVSLGGVGGGRVFGKSLYFPFSFSINPKLLLENKVLIKNFCSPKKCIDLQPKPKNAPLGLCSPPVLGPHPG